MKRLTDRQKEILEYITGTFTASSRIPGISEVARALGINKRSAFSSISSIISKGYLEKSESGSLMLSESLRKNLINERIADYYGEKSTYIAQKYSSLGECFSLIITTDEMKNIGLLPGDEAVFLKGGEASSGDIVLCSLEESDELLIRRLLIRRDGIYDLIPENDTIGRISASNVIIHARLLMSTRRYYE